MKPEVTLKHEFVEYIPERLEERTLYISRQFATAVHKCVCGCGREVVTPLSPTDWKVVSDGRTVSLYPSIGSWNLACRSHYWIRNNQVLWAGDWSEEQVQAGRAHEAAVKRNFYANQDAANSKPTQSAEKTGLWQRFIKWLFG